ncbi:hypothetical protein FLONG3_4873 [Fusarium longipes]|uniref:Uncharacterized protein n=1 Tax=Fusarium longipes TaxID=694270 RepID=A0A395SX28_9HYPO|nr:hypothetical protein FLONG3_4873 [Fusarium longipes]
MLSAKRRTRILQQQSKDVSKRQEQDSQTPEQIEAWCKSTSLTKDGPEIMFPNQGDAWHVGETLGFGWTGGIGIDENQSQTFSLEIGSFDSNGDSEAFQVFANEAFHYPSSSWQIWNKDCPDTYISYYWTIPKDFDVGDTKFVARLLNTTDTENTTTLTSSFFYIDSKPVDVSIQAASIPSATTESAVVTPYPTHSTSTYSASTSGHSTSAPTSTATIEAAASDQTAAVASNSGLSAQAKAGIGAGVGILGFMLILAGLYFFCYRRYQNRGISEKGFVTPALPANLARPRISEGGNSEILRERAREMEDVPGSPLFRTDTERNSHRRSIRIVYEPNQDPIGLPADVSMWSPKTSQDGLNK